LKHLLVSPIGQLGGAGAAGPLSAIAPLLDVCCSVQKLAAQCFSLLQGLALLLPVLELFLLLQQSLLGRVGPQKGLQLLLEAGLQLLEPIG
jgi:hypothetical protein